MLNAYFPRSLTIGDFSYADAWLKEETLGYINGTLSEGPLVYEGLNEQFL
jgi:hypothetical protein